MPIDPLHISRQIGELADYLDNQRGDYSRRLAGAVEAARAHSTPDAFGRLARKIEENRGVFSWLVPGVSEPLTNSHPPSTPLREYIVLAADGSQVEIDRDSPFDMYLINVGRVSIRYGAFSSAAIHSETRVYYRPEDLIIGGQRQPGREHVVGPSVIAARRDTAEVRALADMAEQLPDGVPAIGLLDGSLTQWRVTEADNVADLGIRKDYLDALSRLKNVAAQRDFVVAAYISNPRALEVVNVLRIAVCPFETPSCSSFCRDRTEGERPCDVVAGVRDRDVIAQLLEADGERSGVFRSETEEAAGYGEHHPHFFYMDSGAERARVELPQWSLDRVDRIQTLLWDQIRLGDGYPLALAEAHEEAVVRAQDRELFRQLLDDEAQRRSIPDRVSRKSTAKRQRSL